MRRVLVTLIALLASLSAPTGAGAQYELPPAPEQPQLRVTVIRPSGGSLVAGQRYQWKIRIRNVGRVTARRIVVTGRWEPGLVAVRGGRIDRRARRTIFTAKGLSPRRSRTFLLSGVVAPGATRISVRASVTYKG